MNNFKSLKKYFIKLGKKHPMIKIFSYVIIFILFFDKLFMFIVLTIIAKFNPNVDSFLKNKINSLPFMQKQPESIL